jgi:enoyl-CoA hydratase/carnithine racemase
VETVVVERADGVVTLTMNRPRRKNALTRAMLEELRARFEEVERSAEDRVLVLAGAEGDFCSGADLTDADTPVQLGAVHPTVAQMRRLGDVVLALHRVTKPTIAKVDGVAVGAGLSLALACDLVVASDRARFSLIFARRGLTLDGGASWLLPRRVGAGRAKELALFGDLFDAERALATGVVNRVVPAGELDAACGQWAAQLATGPTMALSMTKALLDGAWSIGLAEALENEAHCQAVNFAGADVAEAMQAFVEKREPRFSGR